MNYSAILLNAVAPTADRYSQWVDTKGASKAIIHLHNTNTGSPVGVYLVHYSQDPVIPKELSRVKQFDGGEGAPTVSGASSAASFVDVTASIPVEAVAGTGLTVNSAGDTILVLEDPARYIRLMYDRTSGGTGASMSAWLYLVEAD